ncbi:hypothetical protein P0Y35_18890 [Kiritimatiellaeota bacterium B1221]|nr:hypothetical protein [Kiritimatiellaeota bacterium B1221]
MKKVICIFMFVVAALCRGDLVRNLEFCRFPDQHNKVSFRVDYISNEMTQDESINGYVTTEFTIWKNEDSFLIKVKNFSHKGFVGNNGGIINAPVAVNFKVTVNNYNILIEADPGDENEKQIKVFYKKYILENIFPKLPETILLEDDFKWINDKAIDSKHYTTNPDVSKLSVSNGIKLNDKDDIFQIEAIAQSSNEEDEPLFFVKNIKNYHYNIFDGYVSFFTENRFYRDSYGLIENSSIIIQKR